MTRIKGWRMPAAIVSAIAALLVTYFYNSHIQQPLASHVKSLISRQSAGSGITLRLLPIGDSITEGYGGNDKNGFRLALRTQLTGAGYSVDFIGSLSGGDGNPDNQHEGFGGYTISGIHERVKSDRILGQHPNIVLIHAGTNDINRSPPSEPYESAPSRLASLMDTVLCEDADAIVLVAMIIQIPSAADRLRTFNAATPGLVAERYRKGFKIRVVDQTNVGAADLADGLHPSSAGYKKMADNWFQAIQKLPRSWFTAPRESARKGAAQTCDRKSLYWTTMLEDKWIASGAKVPGDPGEPLARPGNTSDPTFRPAWTARGPVAIGIWRTGTGVIFMDLNGDGKDDYGWLNSTDGALTAWINKGNSVWEPLNNGNPVASGVGTGKGIYFADVNGDKRDDYIVVRSGGRIEVFLNGGSFLSSWRFEAPVTFTTIAGIGADDLVFGDLNGNGRADVMVKKSDGSIDAYLQTGSGSTFTFQKCANIATTIGNPNIRLIDLDDDGRADFISVDSKGGVTGWLNLPSPSDCGGIFFKQIRNRNDVAAGAAPVAQVRFGDYNGDGKTDYLVVNLTKGAVEAFINNGFRDNQNVSVTGPPRRGPGGYGAGVRLADIDGDGRDDVLAVGPVGEVLAYVNRGEAFGGWSWELQLNGKLIATGHPGAKRHQIHFADINGDGRADYLAVDDATGAAFCYYNRGKAEGGGWIWKPVGKIADGVAGTGLGVRFADLDGDGRADYIWLDEDGGAIAYINTGQGDRFDGWVPVNSRKLIASGTGAKRNDVHFMDYDGDGLADYVWVHPEDGSVDVWFGGGPFNGGWLWFYAGKIAAGIGMPGEQITFGRLGTSGRYDYIGIDPPTAALRGFYNSCFKVIGTGSGAGTAAGRFDGTCLAPPLPATSNPDSGAPDGPVIPDITTTNPQGQTIVSGTQGAITLPEGLSSITTITSEGRTLTFTPAPRPSPDVTTTNDQGQTIISGTRGVLTVPTGLTTAATIISGSQTFTFTPPQSDFVTTNSQGQTVVSNTHGVLTIPTGITSGATITSNGQTFTFRPNSDATTTNSQGQTVLSGTRGVLTLPPGITSQTTITSNGQTFTFRPNSDATTTNSQGQTVLSGTRGVLTLPPGITSRTTITSNGQTYTFDPLPGAVTTANSRGETLISNTAGVFTVPTGLSEATTITNAAGAVATFFPPDRAPATTSTSSIIYGIRPLFEAVSEPEGEDDGTKLPCRLWFFFICISWGDIDIGGWFIDLPPGIYPPGPPPPFKIDGPGITISISVPLPNWPTLTIGPDRKPTFPPKPVNGPNNQCETQTGSICLTRTTFGLSGTVTTATSVLSTCQAVIGCNVDDSATRITTTTRCSSRTVSDCSVGCSITPTRGSLSTTCYTTSCTRSVGCDVTASTRTSTTTKGCPTLPAAPPPPNQVPLMGDGSYGGYVAVIGNTIPAEGGITLVSPELTAEIDGVEDSTSSSSPSPSSSSTPTTTAQPTTTSPTGPTFTTVDPHATSGPICWDEADLPGHADIAWGDVEAFAEDYCESLRELGDASPARYNDEYRRYLNDFDVNYDYYFQWRSGCRTSVESQNIYDPLGNLPDTSPLTLCLDFFTRTYYNCDNGGIGGQYDVGCLRYSFRGGSSELLDL